MGFGEVDDLVERELLSCATGEDILFATVGEALGDAFEPGDELHPPRAVSCVRASDRREHLELRLDVTVPPLVSEVQNGALLLDLVSTSVPGTRAGDGVGLEETDAGIITASVRATTIIGSGDNGIDAESDQADGSTLRLRGSRISGNADDDVALDNVALR